MCNIQQVFSGELVAAPTVINDAAGDSKSNLNGVGTLTTDYQKNTIISIWSIWSIVTIGLNEKLPLCT
jgi:hypothetical protein